MPWKTAGVEDERRRFLAEYLLHKTPLAELSRRWGVSRKTAYKWIGRFMTGGGAAMRDRSSAAGELHNRPAKWWLCRIRRWRARHPSWGAPKLRAVLRRRFGAKGLPSEAAIGRWLKAWSLTVPVHPQRRRRKGPSSPRPALSVPRCCHEVWTADFKGWFKTGDGVRVDPLTVRDLYSRAILAVELLQRPTVARTQIAFARIFARHGLPRVIRTDNGTPFGSTGALGLTRLSVWWLKLGIRVEFIEPGRPDQNGAHEQAHRIYKDETASPPAPTRQGQHRRSQRWLKTYNEERPHEGLQMRRPADLYRKNRRRLPATFEAWSYPERWLSRLVKGKGMVSLYARSRYVGEAFEGERVGLKPTEPNMWQVYLGPHLLGELRRDQTVGICARWYHPKRKST
jgi:transposase InsO family protein